MILYSFMMLKYSFFTILSQKVSLCLVALYLCIQTLLNGVEKIGWLLNKNMELNMKSLYNVRTISEKNLTLTEALMFEKNIKKQVNK